jgi:hypothetical protein
MKNNYSLSHILKGLSAVVLFSLTTIKTFAIAITTASPIITTQPVNRIVCQGDDTYYSIVASGADTYRWQVKVNGITTWDDVPGGTDDTLVLYSPRDIASYRCIVTGGGDSVTSDIATLNFTINDQDISAQTTQVCRGDSTNIIIGFTQPGVDYYLRVGTKTISGPYAGNGNELSISTGPIDATASYNVYASTTAGGCSKILSQTIQISMYTVIPVVTSTNPGSRCLEGALVLSATASEGDLRWYSTPTGGAILGTGTIFTTPVISTSTTFYVSAFQKGCSSARKEVLARVNQLPDVTVKVNGLKIKAVSQNTASYQWMNCNTNTIIQGANDSSYTAPSLPGKYAVIITLNTCKDTSECVPILTTGLEAQTENAAPSLLSVYPNPGRDVINVQSLNAGTFIIVNQLGQTVYSFQLNGSNNYSTTITGLKNGLYVIMGTGDQEGLKQKVVITE